MFFPNSILQVVKIEINASMNTEDLKKLRESSSKFEESVMKCADKTELCNAIMDVFEKSKSALDYSMHLLKENAYPDAQDIIYFPYQAKTRNDLIKKFEKMKFLGIEKKHPAIINFILEKTKPNWVKDFISKRNAEVRID